MRLCKNKAKQNKIPKFKNYDTINVTSKMVQLIWKAVPENIKNRALM
jgi:hypothetical protein